MKTMASSRRCCCWRRWCVVFCWSIFSASGSYFLKFLVSLWSQVFFWAAPQFPEVSAGNCSALSPAQSLKIFFLPTTETSNLAWKSFTWFIVIFPRTPGDSFLHWYKQLIKAQGWLYMWVLTNLYSCEWIKKAQVAESGIFTYLNYEIIWYYTLSWI